MRRAAAALVLAVVAACTAVPTTTPVPSATPGTERPTPTTVQPTPLVTDAPTELVVAVKGDWGAGTPEQAAVTQRMCSVREMTPFRWVLTVGDNFYEPDGVATDDNYTDPEACLLDEETHRWRATWGNHDAGGDATAEVLGAPRRWYRWRAGDAAFYALNSNRVGDPAQRAWLAEGLRGERAPIIVVYFHHPPYTVGRDHLPDRRVQDAWVSLFERYGVTLVLSGHSHVYEHHRRRGIDYVVTGGGGRALDDCTRSMPTMRRCVVEHHFLLLRIRLDRILVHAIAASGETLDRFVARP